MRIAAIVRCYKLTDFLKPVLKNLSDINTVIVANYRFPNIPESEDSTEAVVNALNQDNVYLIKGHISEQKEIFNKCLRLLSNFDYVLINDADEILLKQDREKILDQMFHSHHDAAFTTVIDYTKSQNYIYPIRTHMPVVAVSPRVLFDGNRSPAYGKGLKRPDIHLHHFGYALKDQDWKEKHIWYELESYQNILKQQPIKYETPKEVLEMMTIKNEHSGSNTALP